MEFGYGVHSNTTITHFEKTLHSQAHLTVTLRNFFPSHMAWQQAYWGKSEKRAGWGWGAEVLPKGKKRGADSAMSYFLK